MEVPVNYRMLAALAFVVGFIGITSCGDDAAKQALAAKDAQIAALRAQMAGGGTAGTTVTATATATVTVNNTVTNTNSSTSSSSSTDTNRI